MLSLTCHLIINLSTDMALSQVKSKSNGTLLCCKFPLLHPNFLSILLIRVTKPISTVKFARVDVVADTWALEASCPIGAKTHFSNARQVVPLQKKHFSWTFLSLVSSKRKEMLCLYIWNGHSTCYDLLDPCAMTFSAFWGYSTIDCSS